MMTDIQRAEMRVKNRYLAKAHKVLRRGTSRNRTRMMWKLIRTDGGRASLARLQLAADLAREAPKPKEYQAYSEGAGG